MCRTRSYLGPLHTLKNAWDDCDITKQRALRVLKHFLVGSLRSDFLAYLGPAFDGSRRSINSVLSYSDSVVSDAFKAFRRMRQTSNETEDMFP